MTIMMSRFATFVLLLSFFTTITRADAPRPFRPIQSVDPFISTGGNRYVCGNNPPGATVPFGMVRLSPDTISASGATATNMSGYYYHDSAILGFSHTRLCGTGAVDGGHFRVMPGVSASLSPDLLRNPQATLDHSQEAASPAY